MTQHHPAGKHAPPAKPASAPATPSTPATPPLKPLKWAFPFAPAEKDDAGDPMTYMRALAAAEDGFYPLGANGMWHGGIHFDQNTAARLKQGDGIRAIADGEVVAYRLDSKYPEQDYQDGRHALYSTGFVLIRHRLTLPPAPPPPPKSDASKQPERQATGRSHTSRAIKKINLAASQSGTATIWGNRPLHKHAPIWMDSSLTIRFLVFFLQLGSMAIALAR